ncbi:MAG: 1-acyl-sn-glycerol-3-phosphate acyltransferase [Bacteroidota bacterium]|nr:1-acyl-sn-glycerol-3-phosphate acyltransferase [Bacteroidota bacterium]
MKTLSSKILKILGWRIIGDFPNLDKSVVIFAPHTSYWDGFYGKLFFMQDKINCKFLTKNELFKFPMNYFFKVFGYIPLYKNKEYVNQLVELLNNNKKFHIVLSPEGQLARTDHWKRGFYYMADKANVPIVVGYIDYKKKELGVKGVIPKNSNINTTMNEINRMYRNVNAKYPENFAIDKRFK